ncbi:hypothetical protein SAMN02745148_02495 [Modicisalibacter ilicicola DSM 19980]|uniref:Uncharacterized protein n=1 Tax=Modicisalibacter ilicicola DSM 19980 TaxID=1121942 RepID=A0A1M5B6D6_9GAMM|nr:hypothetical protein [Halomonas ilicicola]SHF38111.1 hypothetical protein SAMN02745148_02495 [Halomonas ilicicola DSM 19980]
MKPNVRVMLLMVWLAGCASTPAAPPERQVEVDAGSEHVLRTGLDVLVERGFVIRFADAQLGRIDAVFASRPGYEVRLATSAIPAGTRLALSGRQGGQAIEPYRFDPLLVEITSRLERDQ